jgi:HAD superfamily hydrolase (TIGR01509 family)
MPRAAIEAVIFDLDGVLVDTEREWDASRRDVAEEAGGRWGPEATTDMMGMSAPEWSRYMHERLGVGLEPDEINSRVVARMLERARGGVHVMDGAVEAVGRLARRWPLGLASSANRPVIEAVLESVGVAELFAAVVSSEEVQRGKPAPDVYLAAAQKLDVEPPAAAAVEDSENGLRSASAAGMVVIAMPNREFPPSAEALALADATIGSLHELDPSLVVGAFHHLR